MKKLVLALLVGLMVLGAASVAAAEITVGGDIEIRYDLWKNLALNNGVGASETQSFWAQRVLLNVDAKITEGLEAFVELDTEDTETTWGGQAQDADIILAQDVLLGYAPYYEGYEYGDLTRSNRNGAGGLTGGLVNDLNHQQSTMRIKQAWINFMVPGLPVGMKIGHQPLALGHGIFLDTHRQGSDSILLYSKPLPELLVAGVFIKGFDSSPTRHPFFGELFRVNGLVTGESILLAPKQAGWNHDVEFYAALANYTWMENNTVGMHFTYVHDNSLLKGLTLFPDPTDFTTTVSLGDHDVWATNTALVADGSIMGINYKGEVDWLHINAEHLFQAVGDAGVDTLGDDYTVDAWAAMLGASYKVANIATVGLEVAYGTGNNRNDANILYDPSGRGLSSVHDNNDHAYYTPYGATSYNYAFLYNDKIGQGPLGSGGGFGFGDGFGGFGLANTGYVKLSVGVNPMDRLSAGIDVLALNASSTSVKDQSRYLGTEVDANASYKIYDNLVLDVKGGVFVPGAWYDFPGVDGTGIVNPDVVVDANDPDTRFKRNTAFGMETKLSVKF